MSALDSINSETSQRMQKAIDSLKKELSRVRAGRATPALLDGITV